MAGTWSTIRTNFLKALVEQRVDRWLVEESKGANDLQTTFRQLGDVIAFSKYLDEKVREEEAGDLGHNGGARFVSFGGGYNV